MYDILSDFIYCLNYNILLFSDGITIPQHFGVIPLSNVHSVFTAR